MKLLYDDKLAMHGIVPFFDFENGQIEVVIFESITLEKPFHLTSLCLIHFHH